jgi:hypothetical protein
MIAKGAPPTSEMRAPFGRGIDQFGEAEAMQQNPSAETPAL